MIYHESVNVLSVKTIERIASLTQRLTWGTEPELPETMSDAYLNVPTRAPPFCRR